jgi:hypothetical protein
VDGTRLAGNPELKILNVSTAYGDLVIPVTDVIRLRFAAVKDTGITPRVDELVKSLGEEEFDKRERAMGALRDIGKPALELLRKAMESEDEEIKTRAEKLVAEIEDEMGEEDVEAAQFGLLSGDDDEVVTTKFVVQGRVKEDTVTVATRYGVLSLNRKDIVSIVFQEGSLQKRSVQVPGNTFAAGNKWVDTKVTVTQGEPLHITATGNINIENYGQTTGPEGTTNISGNQLESHPAGALVGKIGEKGKAFLVASEFQGTASGTGKLYFAVSLQNGNVSGEYQVDVETEAED